MHQPLIDASHAPVPLRATPRVRAVLIVIAIVAIALPLALLRFAPPPAQVAARCVPRAHVVPPAEVPPVEPMRLIDLSPDQARAYNDTVPFADGPNPAARPYHFAGDDSDRDRAIDCLAAAELYEAGDDTTGERAIAQVVLNRLRHPAFPKTVCGVVFQGSERSTGCQFTFSCDGALDRWRPSDAAWDRARSVAKLALSGAVDKPIGYATHYHTDWVVPYWSASLDKIARVGTHLFFRWTGWWGTPPAFNRHPSSSEPVIAMLAPLSPAHAAVDPASVDAALPIDATAIANGGLPTPIAGSPDTFFVTLAPQWSPDSLPALAAASCGARPYCKFMAWPTKAATPATAAITPAQIEAVAFSYLRDKANGYDKALWNCDTFKRADPTQCMKRTPAVAVAKSAIVTPPASTKPIPDGLAGVHRKGDPAPVATPSPAKTGA